MSNTTIRSTRALLAVLLAVVLVVAGCAGDDDGDASAGDDTSTDDSGDDMADSGDAFDGAAEERATDADAPAADGEPESDSALGAGGTAGVLNAADLGRQLIFTASVNVGVDDVAEASAEATTIIEDLGGFLFGQSTEGGVNARSELIFKVLPEDFNVALERLGAVGELRNQTVTTDDVTERVVDLESRIEVAELGVARLRAALESTSSLEDFAEVERLLLARESDLEVMRGQLRTLQDRIDLATITLVLTQERVENRVFVDVSVYEGHDDGRSCSGRSEMSVEESTAVTACFEVVNEGDQTLTDIVVTDSVLEIGPDTALITVFGDLTELAPGQSALVAFETTVDRTVRLRTRVTAIPTDGVEAGPSGPAVNAQGGAEVRTFPSDEGPGFGDGFDAAVGVLAAVWTAAVVTLGFVIPLLVLAPIVWALVVAFRAVTRRRELRAAERSAATASTLPPPAPNARPVEDDGPAD